MARNPKWTRDELILALDLYFRVNPLHTSEQNPEIVSLSQRLNALPIHAATETEANFRNPSGVYMKLCNFLRFDPSYPGVGLSAGSKLDGEIWNEFAQDRVSLARVAQAIRNNSNGLSAPKTVEEELSQAEEEFPEGRVLARVHKVRERNGSLVRSKKREVLNREGRLACEVCGFDFAEKYGEVGEGVCECHHNRPVSELRPGETTRKSDLSIVCSNCHRVIHRTRPWMSVDELKERISS